MASSGAAACAADADAAAEDDTAASCEDDVDQRDDVDGAPLASKSRCCCSPADAGSCDGDGVRYACTSSRTVPVGAVHSELAPILWWWSGKSEGAATPDADAVNDDESGDDDDDVDAFFFLRPAISSARIPRRIAGVALATSGPLLPRVCSPVDISLVVAVDDVFVASAVTCLGTNVLLFLRRIPPTSTLGDEHVCAVDAPDDDTIRKWFIIVIEIYIYIYIYTSSSKSLPSPAPPAGSTRGLLRARLFELSRGDSFGDCDLLVFE